MTNSEFYFILHFQLLLRFKHLFMKLPHKTLERKLFASGYSPIYAVDEVGMGCLAGPVVVCVVGIKKDFHNKARKNLRNLRESKLLSVAQREKFAEELLKEKDLVYAIAQCSPKTIDKLNVYHAARLAMKRAVLALRPIQQGFRVVSPSNPLAQG